MNARQHEFALTLELRQIPDALVCIFHSLLLHRSVGKFTYKNSSNFSLGSIGVREEDCKHIDLTYIRVNCDELDRCLWEDIRAFKDDVERETLQRGKRSRKPNEPVTTTQIGMQFYHKKKKSFLSYLTSEECVPWELWNVQLNVCSLQTEDLAGMRESTAEAVSDVILSLCSSLNRPQYVPKMPTAEQHSDIFDPRFQECEPFLFKIIRPHSSATGDGGRGVANTMRKLVKDTLYL